MLGTAEATPETLFDAVKLCNFNENSSVTGTQSILVEAVGIQSENLGLSEINPETVWQLAACRQKGVMRYG